MEQQNVSIHEQEAEKILNWLRDNENIDDFMITDVLQIAQIRATLALAHEVRKLRKATAVNLVP